MVAHVADLDAAAARMLDLGFTLSPRSDLANVGVANHLVLLPPSDPACASFFELMMSTVPAHSLHPSMAAVLTGPPAWRWLVLATADAHAAQRRLLAMGVKMGVPTHVRREWRIDADQSVWPEFDVTFPCDEALPFNLCQYHNVALYQRAEWLQHTNGANRLRAVVAVDAQAESTARRCAAWFGAEAMPLGAEGTGAWSVQCTPTSLEVWPPAAFAAHHPGGSVASGYAGIRVSAPGPRRLVWLAPQIEGFIELCGADG